MKDYTFDMHRHNYAIWTAARAVQRDFTKTINIKFAIDQSSLQSFVQSDIEVSEDSYSALHQLWADQLIEAFEKKGVVNPTYGRAAKIISIYLKTSIVLCSQGGGTRSAIIHPPIDSILLKNLSALPGLIDLKKIKWTQLGKDDYWNLVQRLKNHLGAFDWRLEYYWTPE